MTSTANLAEIAALVGNPARAAMLIAVMDGRALTAGELAEAGGVSAATASAHLAQLTDAGLLALEQQGRHRYHRLASPAIAAMLEGIMAVAGDPERRPVRRVHTGPRDGALRLARSCYDHLAGRVAVAIADGMIAARQLDLSADGGLLTAAGAEFMRSIGITPSGPASRRPFCRPCLDWSERRPHIGGWLGMAMLTRFRDQGWVRAQPDSRALTLTPAGVLALTHHFALADEVLRVG